MLGKLFRRLFLTRLIELHDAGKLVFFGAQAELADRRRFLRHLAPLRTKRWVVYAKAPFAGPEAVLAYLSLYTHRVAISNRRLIAFDEAGVTFRYKDYRRSGPQRQQVMTLDTHEFMRRFLLHVLPHGFHRIRHYGLFASATRKANIARARELLAAPTPSPEPSRPQSRPISSRPVLAAAGACASSRPSNAGCSRARRPRARSNRGAVVTRHGLPASYPATPPSRRMPRVAPFAEIGATRLNLSRGRFPIHASPGRGIHSPGRRQLQTRAGSETTTAEQNSKSP